MSTLALTPELGLNVDGGAGSALAGAAQIRHLRYFIVVAEELHFRHTAERVHADQTLLPRTVPSRTGRYSIGSICI
ncbi:hypothetical protein ACSFA7_32225 [Variovorax sp. LT1R20]|uniref:hypothetical protein n=1 Tax=Variovorax sp. LT1R20 TaxID=3443729 RepID=UPI003F45DA2F